MKKYTSDQWLGLIVFVFAIPALCIWIQLDTETGLTEKMRRRIVIGDALAPSIASIVLIFGALLTWFKPDTHAPSLTKDNLKWIGSLTVIFVLSLTIMRYLGPLLASMFTETGYRPLRDTLPWKYIGIVTGGTVMVATLSAVSQARPWGILILIGAISALMITFSYDLPFDNLLLPPNGDL